MGEFHDFRLRLNNFVEHLDSLVEDIINDNQELLDLNRHQLKEEHSTTKDEKISPEYSKSYAEFKGFKTPDIFATGKTQETHIS